MQDCTISCAIGNAVVIGARGAPFRGQGSTQALCEAHGRLPRLVNCRIESPVVSQPAEVGGHEGVAAGVCVEVMAAEIVSCSFHGNFNQIELGYSKPGTLIHGCHLDGAQENGIYSYDEAQARIICTAIRGGRECVRCCEGSRLVLEECSLEGFSSSGVSAQDQVRQDRKDSPPHPFPRKKLKGIVAQGSVVELRDSSVQGDWAGIECADGARVFLNGKTLQTPDDCALMVSRFKSGAQEWSAKTELNEAPADQAVAHSTSVSASGADGSKLSTRVDAGDPRPAAEPVTPAWPGASNDMGGGCRTPGGLSVSWWKSLCALVVLGGAVVAAARRLGYQPQRGVIVRWWRRAMLRTRLQRALPR